MAIFSLRSVCRPSIFVLIVLFFLIVQIFIFNAGFFSNHQISQDLINQLKNKSKSEIILPCDLQQSGQSAFQRATSTDCKNLIARIDCLQQINALTVASLPNLCPKQVSVNFHFRYIGCYSTKSTRAYEFGQHPENWQSNNPSRCVQWCRNLAAPFAGLVNRTSCLCSGYFDPDESNRLEDERWCQMGCPGGWKSVDDMRCGSSHAMAVYSTGISVIRLTKAGVVSPSDYTELVQNRGVRVAFLLVLSGRSWRQVKRLFNLIYHVNHYFYVHVDQRNDYLHYKVAELVRRYPNVRLTPWRMATIWGGSSLLQMLLHAMEDLLAMTDWKWDFFVNLSESDLPIKTNALLTTFLSVNRDKNFVRFSGRDYSNFIRKQGLNQLFVECDHHMWHLGDRELPQNMIITGGSDWIVLNHRFIHYIINSKDAMLEGVKSFFKYSILPAESFFHVTLLNSGFCENVINNNLHVVNWKRNIGCKCQHRKVVDWCGCSPNVFRFQDDRDFVESNKHQPNFFGRKFDSAIDVPVINWLEEKYHGINLKDVLSVENYWENIFSSQWDTGPSYDVYRTGLESLTRLSRNLALEELDVRVGGCSELKWSLTDASAFFTPGRPVSLLIRALVGASEFETGAVVETKMELRGNRSSGYKRFPATKKLPIVESVRDRLVNFEIGLNCDPKEFTFRDYTHIIGTTSTITISTTWKKGPPVRRVHFTFLDSRGNPLYQIQAVDVTTTDFTVECLTAEEIHSPLYPGLWTVLLSVDTDKQTFQLAQNTFLVIPVAYNRGFALVDSDEAALVNRHVGGSLEDNPSGWTGTRLANFVDTQVAKTWKPTGHCIVSTEAIRKHAACFHLDLCKGTRWSTYYPDPKSDLGSINPHTGLLRS